MKQFMKVAPNPDAAPNSGIKLTVTSGHLYMTVRTAAYA
jgi:hypothetical protein